MIRYIELTPNADIPFQSGKIVRTLVEEGDSIEVGDQLFIVDAQGKEAQVTSSKAGKINELIVQTDDVIHKLSSLLVLETVVADKPQEAAPAPFKEAEEINQKNDKPTDQNKAKKPKQNRQQPKQNKSDSDNQSSLNFDQTDSQSSSDLKEAQENKTIMSEIKVPDLGGADAVEVIDILVNVGDKINADDPIMTVESDKASMDIPASSAGMIEEIIVKLGDNVSEGDIIVRMKGADSASNDTKKDNIGEKSAPEATPKPREQKTTTQVEESTNNSTEIDIIIPDLGGATDVDVIEVLVAVGDNIAADQALITVESDKASMDVPSAHAGTIQSISIEVGDTVNEGDTILIITSDNAPVAKADPAVAKAKPEKTQAVETASAETVAKTTSASPSAPMQASQEAQIPSGPSHASPSVRRLARELGVDLAKVVGSSRKNRIIKSDVKAFVKSALVNGYTQTATTGASSGAGIPEVPAQDFSKFGEIELQPLNKIKRLTAQHLHRAWLNIPHVTHHDETNIQSLEDFRKTLNAEYAKQDKGIKLSPLAFIVKAVVNALQNFPQFNSSLENGGNNLIVKKYYHIGIAVETPNGLVVPVIRDADKLSVAEIAAAMGDLAKKARDGKLTPKEMQGGTFSISSLGGIGGTSFTPIVNAPEVAILGVSRTKIQPVWNGTEFVPAPILPLSLSYDHRVIDGAEAARFTRHIAVALEDIRRLTV